MSKPRFTDQQVNFIRLNVDKSHKEIARLFTDKFNREISQQSVSQVCFTRRFKTKNKPKLQDHLVEISNLRNTGSTLSDICYHLYDNYKIRVSETAIRYRIGVGKS